MELVLSMANGSACNSCAGETRADDGAVVAEDDAAVWNRGVVGSPAVELELGWLLFWFTKSRSSVGNVWLLGRWKLEPAPLLLLPPLSCMLRVWSAGGRKVPTFGSGEKVNGAVGLRGAAALEEKEDDPASVDGAALREVTKPRLGLASSSLRSADKGDNCPCNVGEVVETILLLLLLLLLSFLMLCPRDGEEVA